MKRHFASFALAVLLCSFLTQPSHGADGNGIDNPTGVTGEYNGSVTTGGSYDPYTGNAKRFIDDLTVVGSVGAYPLKWTRILNTRGIGWLFGGGGGWSHSYQWGLHIASPAPEPPPTCYPDGPDAIVYYPDGRIMNLRLEENPTRYVQVGGIEPMGDRLVHRQGEDYDLMLKDGGRVEFRTVNGVFQTPRNIVDPYGQTTTLEYNSGHLWRIIEPAGRYLEISYITYPPENGIPYSSSELIDHVTSYDGPQGHAIETVSYHYTKVLFNAGWMGLFRFFNLTRVTYADDNGPQEATYTYYDPAWINPDDWHTLAAGNVRTCDDVRFSGNMSKIEYEYTPPWQMAQGQRVRGHIWAEKNMTTHEAVSRVDYPTGPSNWFTRKETRADGATRIFTYSPNGDPELLSYTDFAYPGEPHHATTISFVQGTPGPEAPINPDHYRRVVKDARQYSTKTEKERNIGAVIAVIHPNGSSVKYTYSHPNDPYHSDDPYYLASKENESGNVTYYDRDSANRIWRIRYPDGGFETFTYTENPFGLVHEHRMTSGGTEVFTYDSRGRKETYTPPATLSDQTPGAHPTRYFYYEDGPHKDRLRYVVDPRGNATWHEYNGRGQVTKVTHQDGFFTQSVYNRDGTLAWTADENHPNAWMDGHEYERTRYEYDEYKRVTKVINPLGKETRSDYTPLIGGLSPFSHTTSSVYHVTSHTGKVIDYDYDANFRRTRMTVAPNTAEPATTSYTYDEVGNLKTVKDPKGQSSSLVTTYGYDDRNLRISATDALGHTTAWLYDDAGNMTRETRADTKFRTWDEYDAMNRIKHTTGFLHEPTSYIYDPAGNLTMMTDANGGVYSTAYDELNRKKSATYPLDAGNANRTETWLYDEAGNLKTYKSPANQYKHFEYDNRNRQTHSYWNSSETGTNIDQTIGDETLTGFDAASRVENIRANGASAWTLVAYGYDNANHKIWEDQSLSGGWPTRRVETLADDDGNRGTLSVAGVPDGYSFTYQYTQRQQLRHISRGGSPYFEYSYDENGNLTKRQHMTQGQGQDSTKFVYDDINRVTLCDQKVNDSSFFARSNYNDYDLVNNLKSISRHEDQDQGELFDYDDANQLRGVSYKVDVVPHAPGPGFTGGDSEEVEKDTAREALAALEADPVREPLAEGAVGIVEVPAGPRTVTYTNDSINRTSMNDNGTVTNYTPNHLNQYTAVTGPGAPPVYDTNFNLSVYQGWHYVFDAEKRLTSVTGNGHSAQFVYDGLGRCVKRTIDGVTTVITYDEWKPIVEWGWSNGASQVVAWNLYGPGADEILVRNQPSTAGYVYYHLDATGNVQFLLSDTLGGLEKYTYDVFGKPTIMGWNGGVRPISQYGNRFLFTGREYLYTLGIYDYRHRHYHPGLGRFIQTDPIGLEGDPMNLYRYCSGNPINRSDPMGLNPEPYHLTHLGGTDFGAYDPDSVKPQAGPDGAGGSGNDGESKSVSKEDEGPKQSGSSQTSADPTVPAKFTRKLVSSIEWKDPRTGTYWVYKKWVYTLTNQSNGSVGRGVQVNESISQDQKVDYRDFQHMLGSHLTDEYGRVTDVWKLGFSSPNGSVRNTQTLSTPNSTKTATHEVTIGARGWNQFPKNQPLEDPVDFR